MENNIDELIDFYKKLWVQAKERWDVVSQNTRIKANREEAAKLSEQRVLYTKFIDELIHLRQGKQPIKDLQASINISLAEARNRQQAAYKDAKQEAITLIRTEVACYHDFSLHLKGLIAKSK